MAPETPTPNWPQFLALLDELRSFKFETSADIESLTARVVTMADRCGVMYPLDRPAWDAADRIASSPAALADATISDLRSLLVMHIRKDRFVEGHLNAVIEGGHLREILERAVIVRAAERAALVEFFEATPRPSQESPNE